MACQSCNMPATLQGLGTLAQKNESLRLITSIDTVIAAIDSYWPKYSARLEGTNFSWWIKNWLPWKEKHAENKARVSEKSEGDWFGWGGWVSGLTDSLKNLIALRDALVDIERADRANQPPPPPPKKGKGTGVPSNPGDAPPNVDEYGGDFIAGVPNAVLYVGAGLLLFAIWRGTR